MTAAHHGFRRRGVPPLPDIVKDPRIRIDQIIHPRTAGSVDPAAVVSHFSSSVDPTRAARHPPAAAERCRTLIRSEKPRVRTRQRET